METQKMPPTLRRSSWISMISSQTNTGERSRSSSFGSASQRSRSTPATSAEEVSTEGSEQWHSIVSQSAPKLPGFGWSSRRSSSANRKSPSCGSEPTYDGDIITFAYQLDATHSALVDEPEKRDRFQPRQKSDESPKRSMQQQQSNVPPLKRSCTEPDLSCSTEQAPPSTTPQQSPAAIRSSSADEKSQRKKRPHSEKPFTASDTRETTAKMVSATAEQNHSSSWNSTSLQSAFTPQLRPSHDGGSYVHKQRMYQQQQCIAGFEEQQAVQDANDLAAEYEALLSMPQTPQSARGRTPTSSKLDLTTYGQLPEPKEISSTNISVSPTRNKQRHRSSSPQAKSILAKQHSHRPSTLSQEPVHNFDTIESKDDVAIREPSQTTRESMSSSRSQAPTGFKANRILGFRRRAKEPQALVSVPYSPEEHIVAVHSAPPEIAPHEEPVTKRSKIERLFREPKPAFAEEASKRRSGSVPGSPAKEGSPGPKPAQSHSRTRTASSAALTGNLRSPKSPPRSNIGPVNSTPQPTKSALKVKDSSQSPNSKLDVVQSPERPPRKQATILVDPKPVRNAAADVTNEPKTVRPVFSFEYEEKAMNRSMQEVIVESETGEGLIRKASLTRPRSNPQLQTQSTASNSLRSLDFLPQLKHQPLVKRDRQSPTRPSASEPTSTTVAQFITPIGPLTYQPPSPSSVSSEPDLKPDLKLLPRSPLRPSQFPVPTTTRANRSATEVGTLSFPQSAVAENLGAKPVAKLFVICCKCKFWHDLPSKLYEAMALPLELHKAQTGEGRVAGARLETAVKCPWCEHAMTTGCCQGWTTVVYLHERHH
ncbi:hypothetical protein P7C71_g2052, partial [Lecanoromycetidae sp. Uapishka_2]